MSLLGERNYDLLRSLFLVHNSKRKSPYIGLRFSDHEYSYSRSKAKHARARTRLFRELKQFWRDTELLGNKAGYKLPRSRAGGQGA